MNQPWSLINWVQSFFQSVHKKKRKKKPKGCRLQLSPSLLWQLLWWLSGRGNHLRPIKPLLEKQIFSKATRINNPLSIKKIFNNFILILQEEVCMKSWHNDFGSERSTRKFSALFIFTTQQVTLSRTMSERLLTIGPGGPWGPSPPFKPAEPWKQKVHLH